MASIITLTMNPSIDVAYEVESVGHTHKMRTDRENIDPGGGGINVARVLARLGAEVRAVYLAGGATGSTLDGLLDRHPFARTRIAIAGNSRISMSLYARDSGKEYRVVPAGPTVSAAEWQQALSTIAGLPCDTLVLSGSLPPEVPDDFYAQLVARAGASVRRVVLDTSGAALASTLAGGGIHLVKPSIGELRKLTGAALESIADVAAAATAIVQRGQAELVAVSMGHEGGLLATADTVLRLPAIAVEAQSAVGAGDSFVAAMTFALTEGWATADAFRYGLAAGAAAVMTPGTELCHKADIDRLYAGAG